MAITFALFALFAIGSAAAVDCTDAKNDTKVCVDGSKFIGRCSSSSCAASTNISQCSGNVKDTMCFDPKKESLKGVCLGSDKKCKYTGVVDVDYIVEALANDSTSLNKMKTDKAIFEPSYGDQQKAACNPVRTYVIVDATMSDCPENHYFNDSQKCNMSCNNNTKELTPHTSRCNASSNWEGDVGICGKTCLADSTVISSSVDADVTVGATNKHGEIKDNKLIFKRKVEDGVLTCAFKNTLPVTPCILTCNPGHRVKTSSEYVCGGVASESTDGAWGGNVLGECEESKDLAASVSIVLGVDDDISDAAGKAAFTQKFKGLVSGHLSEVEALHVSIVNLEHVVDPNVRRLNERSVLVDYTIQAAKDDPNTATELDKDDGRLLRGIQEGLRGIQ